MKILFILLMTLAQPSLGSSHTKPMATATPSSVVFQDLGQITTVDIVAYIHLDIPVAPELKQVIELCNGTDALGADSTPFTKEQRIPLFNLRSLHLHSCSRLEMDLVDVTKMFGDPKILDDHPLIQEALNQIKSREKELATPNLSRTKRSADNSHQNSTLTSLHLEQNETLPTAQPLLGFGRVGAILNTVPTLTTLLGPRSRRPRTRFQSPRRPRYRPSPTYRRPPPITTTPQPPPIDYSADYDYSQDYQDYDYPEEYPEPAPQREPVSPVLKGLRLLSGLLGRKKRSSPGPRPRSPSAGSRGRSSSSRGSRPRPRSPSAGPNRTASPGPDEGTEPFRRLLDHAQRQRAGRSRLQQAAHLAQRHVQNAQAAVKTAGSAIAQAVGLKALKGQTRGFKKLSRRSAELSLNTTDSDLVLSRPPRFLGALVSTVFAGLVGLATGASYRADLAKTEDLNKFARLATHHAELEDQQINLLGRRLNDTITEIVDSEHILSYSLSYYQLDSYLQLVGTRVDRLVTGLRQLAHRRLDPGLVDLPHLGDQLKDIQQSMASKGGRLILSSPLDVFSFDVSSSFDPKNLTMKVTLLVPGEYPSSRRNLKRWVPFPVRTAEDTEGLYVLPMVQTDLLGIRTVPSANGNDIRSITAEDLSMCHQHGNLYVCPSATWEHQSLGSDCLASLYAASLKPSSSRVKETCPFTPADSHSYAVRIGPQDYRVFLSKVQPLTGRCRSGTTSLGARQGLLSIHVPENCSVSTQDFVLRPLRRLQDLGTLLETHELSITEGLKDPAASKFHLAHQLGYVSPSGLTLDDAHDFIAHEEGVLSMDKPWVSILLWGSVSVVASGLLLYVLHMCGIDLPMACRVTRAYFQAVCGTASANSPPPPAPMPLTAAASAPYP